MLVAKLCVRRNRPTEGTWSCQESGEDIETLRGEVATELIEAGLESEPWAFCLAVSTAWIWLSD